ncbi:hypothetical protein [Agitococcus lubricus]|uniref:DUF4124 domain-containing protein n=1 Tax=Agitococcus lubricus TaxID=1077255 RepID=A0A2T5IZV8_9GAMM|nr:hypothetical protein [Agitococcus lubricus]PTQ89573.1 hypothetical protein C8N29_106104 [Agitococcus lubricus]
MKTLLSLTMLTLACTQAQAADIYTCERNGKKEFSQQPCGENATIIKDKHGDASFKITIPMSANDILKLCQLVLKAKDKEVAANKPMPRYYNNGYYDSYDRYSDTRRKRNSAQNYILSRISNLEQIAAQSPAIYDMLKNLAYDTSYQGYDETPVYQAERAAALTRCQERVSYRVNRDEN